MTRSSRIASFAYEFEGSLGCTDLFKQTTTNYNKAYLPGNLIGTAYKLVKAKGGERRQQSLKPGRQHRKAGNSNTPTEAQIPTLSNCNKH